CWPFFTLVHLGLPFRQLNCLFLFFFYDFDAEGVKIVKEEKSYYGGVCSRGSLTVNVLPSPSADFTVIVPPCCSTMPLTMYRPNPSPPSAWRSWRVAWKNLLKIDGKSWDAIPGP